MKQNDIYINKNLMDVFRKPEPKKLTDEQIYRMAAFLEIPTQKMVELLASDEPT